MLDTVLAIVELSEVGQEIHIGILRERLVVQTYGIASDNLQSDTTHSRNRCSEVVLQQALRQTDALEDLCTTIRPDGRNTHLSHNLEETLLHSLDIVGLCSGIVFLNLMTLYEVVEDSECHIRTDSRCTISQEQGSVHSLTDFTALNDKSRLHTLSDRDEVVVNSRDSQQRRNGSMCLIHVTVAENNIVVTIIHTSLSVLAQLVESVAQSFLALCTFEENRQFDGIESLVSDVAEDVELSVVKDRMGQTHHLAVSLVG